MDEEDAAGDLRDCIGCEARGGGSDATASRDAPNSKVSAPESPAGSQRTSGDSKDNSRAEAVGAVELVLRQDFRVAARWKSRASSSKGAGASSDGKNFSSSDSWSLGILVISKTSSLTFRGLGIARNDFSLP